MQKNSKINIVEKFLCSKELKLPIKTEVFSNWLLEENTELAYYGFGTKTMNKESVTANNICVKQKRNSVSSFSTFYWELGSTNNYLEIWLKEPQAVCNIFSISLLKNNSCVDNNITLNHNASACESSQVYKGVFDDDSKGVFNSTVFVQKNAQKTSSIQQNNNILLSDYASVNSNPQLEIFADDVACAHGSTIGQIDPKALFYLQSRGLDKDLATNMLLRGFLNDVVEEIQDVKIKESVLLTLAEKL